MCCLQCLNDTGHCAWVRELHLKGGRRGGASTSQLRLCLAKAAARRSSSSVVHASCGAALSSRRCRVKHSLACRPVPNSAAIAGHCSHHHGPSFQGERSAQAPASVMTCPTAQTHVPRPVLPWHGTHVSDGTYPSETKYNPSIFFAKKECE